MNILKSKLFRLIGTIGLLVVAIVGWVLISPLFIDQTVDEALPSLEQISAMSDEEKASVMDRMMSEAAKASDSAMTDPMPGDAPTLTLKGRFSDVDALHKGEGQAAVYNLGGGQRILRFEDFKVTNGPDLRVWLASATGAIDANAVKSSQTLDLGELKGNVGNQNYSLPEGVDLSIYKTVVIWCRAFGVLFSPANLEPA